MMHDRFESLVDLLLARGLDDAERRDAESHAASCSPCGALLADARSFHAWAAGAIAPDAPPADLEDRLIVRFRAAKGAKPRRSWPRLARVLKIGVGFAAVTALIILGATFTNATMDAPTSYLSSVQANLVAHSGVQDSGVGGVYRGSNLGWVSPDAPNRTEFGFSSIVTEGGRSKPRNGTLVDVVSDGTDLEVRKAPEAGVPGTSGTYAVHSELHSLAKNMSEEADALNFPSSDLGLAAAYSTAAPKPAPEPTLREEAQVSTLAVAKNLAHLETVMKEGSEPSAEPVRLQADRKLIRKGVLAVEVEAYDAASTRIAAIAAEEKGYVADADTERLANGKVHAVLVLRVPPDRFESTLAKLRALGTVRNQSVTSEDVTKAYTDFEARLGAKSALLERLKKVLADAKGTVKELMEVEVQMGKTQEEIEAIKGELQYLAGQVAMTTIKVDLSEKDLGQPFEVVQTLQAAIGITSAETEAAYVRAQKAVADAGGQVVDSNLVRSKDGSAKGTIKAKVDAEKFPALREELRKLGHVDVDTVVDRKTARGGQEGPARPDAPVRKEQAVITLSIVTPPIHVARRAQLSVETADVEGPYLAARKSVEAAGGRVLGGSVTGRTDGMSANLIVQVDTGRFVALLDGFRAAGKVLHSTSSQAVPPAEGALVHEKGEIEFVLSTPPALIGEEHGIARTVRETFAGSWAGLLWSVEKLFVGISLAGPWLALLAAAWLVWRRIRRKKAAQPAA